MIARMVIFFTSVSFLIGWIAYKILCRRFNLTGNAQRGLALGLALGCLTLVIGPAVYRWMKPDPSAPFSFGLQALQYFFMGWVGVVVITGGFLEILEGLTRTFDPSKRVWFTEGVAKGVVAFATGSSLLGAAQVIRGPKVEPVSIFLKTLPDAFEGFRIVQLSDVHIGPLLHRDFLESVVAQVQALKPDAVVLTGDLVDGTVQQLAHHVEPFKKLSAPFGIFFITGNHEYYSGADEWSDWMRAAGITVLQNSAHVLEKVSASGVLQHLAIAGVPDLQAERFHPEHRCNPSLALQACRDVAVRILLAHNPKTAELKDADQFHVQLSGHTHAGQFFPFSWIARVAHRYFNGLYAVSENRYVYVNRGTGFWGPPNRFLSSGEITHLTLRRSS